MESIIEQQQERSAAVGSPRDRVDGRLKVTGAATYAAEYKLPNMAHAVLLGSTIAKGRIKSIDARQAERAPGVLAVISHVNSPKVPGYNHRDHPTEPAKIGQPLRVFYDETIYFSGQPFAMVVADTLERAQYAAGLVIVSYEAQEHHTDFDANRSKAELPTQAKRNPKSGMADYVRGQEDAYKTANIKLEVEYVQPTEVHNPMELQAIIAHWEAPDRLTLYDKTQGVKDTQSTFAEEWDIPVENVRVISKFVGGAFGNALHTWPHHTAAIIAAKKVGRPVKLMLNREQMFTMVGYRPHAWQKIGMSATPDGKLTAITHEATGQTSTYEEFTESTLQQTRMLYTCPNVTTRYRLLPLNVSTPIWMRGPGEATGAIALESAMDEMAYKLNLDPLDFRLRNYAEKDADNGKPWSTNYLRECYNMGAERIGWHERQMQPGALRAGEWLVGYGMAAGVFGAHRGAAKASARLLADGTVLIRSATTNIGPGTATAMVLIASDVLGIDPAKVDFQLGDSTFPDAPKQGGSSTVNSVGSAVRDVCLALQQRLQELAAAQDNAAFSSAKPTSIVLDGGKVRLVGNTTASVAYADLLKQNQGQEVDVTAESKPDDDRYKYSMYSFAAHFAKVHVHPATGQVRVQKIVCCADGGTIINTKTAANQMKGGAVGGIGMALTEEAIMDDRFGRYVTKDLASYHVPVHADAPPVEVAFVNKPDLIVDPNGTKGLGEIAIIGVAPAIANAVFNATGKRIRQLPITPDKLV
ncbi:xanthine dehydrogenase family protein molybdopterin-binding subunit [Pontibacter chitinilyticus]|uniref:xanthine dehydrogenase family protein molybdopterin-binding subunit n=1 Tax=Pontibacter chitinilyticus TaxID=2674989 RepID=UPI00321B3186